MLSAAMPKTTIDEDDYPLPSKGEVWFTGQRQVATPTCYSSLSKKSY